MFEKASDRIGLTDDQNIEVHWIDAVLGRLWWMGSSPRIRLSVITYLVANEFERDARVRRTKNHYHPLHRHVTQKLCADAFGVTESGLRAALSRLFKTKLFRDYAKLHSWYQGPRENPFRSVLD